MDFPFSASIRRKNQNLKSVVINKNKSVHLYNMYPNRVHQVSLDLSSFSISPEIEHRIIENEMFYNRMNIPFLFIAYQFYLTGVFPDELSNYIKIRDLNIQEGEIGLKEQKFEFEIKLYFQRIKQVETKEPSLFLRIDG